jgi:hypothetical protein
MKNMITRKQAKCILCNIPGHKTWKLIYTGSLFICDKCILRALKVLIDNAIEEICGK